MTWLFLACCLCNALTFEEQDIPGIWVGPVKPLTSEPATNFIHIDLNNDSAPDILLGREILFQEEGKYPKNRRRPLPKGCIGGELDSWGSRLFLKTPDHLRIWKYNGMDAELLSEQAISWPETPDPAASNTGDSLRRGRFLHDVNNDGEPEIIAIGQKGVQLFAGHDHVYQPVSEVLSILPALQLAQRPNQPIWPRERRRLVFPPRQMLCDVVLDGPNLSIQERQPLSDGVIYRRNTWNLTKNGDTFQLGEAPTTILSQKVPEYVRPCRLDDTPDPMGLAGVTRIPSTARNLSIDLAEIWVSLDGGVTKTIRRTPTLPRVQPQAPLVDVNGDGKVDLVTESCDLLDGGGRELVERILSRSRLTHHIAVYLQESGAFSEKSTRNIDISIHLGAAPWRNPPMFQRYTAGEVVQFTQDIDGDGQVDVVAREEDTEVSVRLFRESGFTDPINLPIPAEATLAVADINKDGKADLIFMPPAPVMGAPRSSRPVQVFFSQGDRP